jgi:hypothetical protein
MINSFSFKTYTLGILLLLFAMGCIISNIPKNYPLEQKYMDADLNRDSVLCAKYACLFKRVSKEFWKRGVDDSGDYYLLADPIYYLDSIENYTNGKLPYFLSKKSIDVSYYSICTHYSVGSLRHEVINSVCNKKALKAIIQSKNTAYDSISAKDCKRIDVYVPPYCNKSNRQLAIDRLKDLENGVKKCEYCTDGVTSIKKKTR